MFRKELAVLAGLALAVFLIVAALTSLAVRAVQRDGYMLADDTFPGLVSAGEAIDRMNENWFNIHILSSTPSLEEAEKLIAKISSNSTEEIWQRYRASIFDEEDARLFSEMRANRQVFLDVRSSYFDLIRARDMPAAQRLFSGELSSAFDRYHQSAQTIFQLNARVGSKRASRLIHLSHWTPYVFAGLCVMVLLIGVAVGFKASLGAFTSWDENS